MDRLDTAPASTMRVACDPEVVGCTLGDGAALLNLRTNIYYSLNEVGSFVWDALGEGVSFADLVTRVCAAFDAPRGVVEEDLTRLVREMDAAGLVQCTVQ